MGSEICIRDGGRTVTVPDKEVYKAKEAIVAVGYAIAGEKDDSR